VSSTRCARAATEQEVEAGFGSGMRAWLLPPTGGIF
jgi:hypothetical protein